MSALVITGLLLAGGVAVLVLIRRRLVASRPVVLGMIAGGWGAVGSGAVGSWLEQVARSAAAGLGDLTATAVGVSLPGLALALVVAWLAVDLRDRRIVRVTPWLGLLLPTMAAVVGGIYAGQPGLLGTLGETLLWAVRLPGSL